MLTQQTLAFYFDFFFQVCWAIETDHMVDLESHCVDLGNSWVEETDKSISLVTFGEEKSYKRLTASANKFWVHCLPHFPIRSTTPFSYENIYRGDRTGKARLWEIRCSGCLERLGGRGFLEGTDTQKTKPESTLGRPGWGVWRGCQGGSNWFCLEHFDREQLEHHISPKALNTHSNFPNELTMNEGIYLLVLRH